MVPFMNANANVACSLSSSNLSLELLSDGELLDSTRRLVGRSNLLLAELLGHLAEVEARGIHRLCACASLYAYCIYELRFSEDEAFRRVAAARLVKRFPSLMASLAVGELHLTGLLMLGPHLTEENIAELLVRAKHRTKRELARLVRALDPLPAVPARIEPLGPRRRGSYRARLRGQSSCSRSALSERSSPATGRATGRRTRTTPRLATQTILSLHGQ
jgi:hypothetical protein